jgi:cytochrome c biogenesis protein CcmG/thiol:disulfide interchange protein DsbE
MHRRLSIRFLGLALALGPCALVACGGAASDTTGSSLPGPGDAAHPLLGKQGPDFAMKNVTGNTTVSLHALSGKVAVVDFWATWCEPCKKSFPKLEAIHAKYKAEGLEIVGVSEDDENTGIPAFASDLGARFPLVWDDNKAIASKWQPKSMPSTFILDRSGRVRFVHFGYHDDEEATIEREIKSLL